MVTQTAVPHLSSTPPTGFLSPPKAEPAWTSPAEAAAPPRTPAPASPASTGAVACAVFTPSGSKAADAAALVQHSQAASGYEVALTNVEPCGVLEAMFRSGLGVVLRMPDQAQLPMTISAITGPPTGRTFYLLPTE